MQVRGLLDGQGWYDLSSIGCPPARNIHWSRLVDLPIAGDEAAASRPFVRRRDRGEDRGRRSRRCCRCCVAMAAVAVIARRLIAPLAFALAIALLACAGSAQGHVAAAAHRPSWLAARHACLGRGGADRSEARARRRDRSARRPPCRWPSASKCCSISRAAGAVDGAAAGSASGEEARRLLRLWRHPRRRLRARLSCSSPPRPIARRSATRCRRSGCRRWSRRARSRWRWPGSPRRAGRPGSALAAVAGALLAAAFVLVWPDCVGRLERVPPELDRLWLSKVREAMPVWRHGAQTAALIVTLPIAGLIGYALMLWQQPARPRSGSRPGPRSRCSR